MAANGCYVDLADVQRAARSALIPHADLATAKAVAERVQAALRQTTLPPAPGVRCTASVGAACRPAAGADDLFAAADRALYRAKQRGRDRLVLGGDEGAA